MGGGFTHGNNKQAIAAAWTMDATYCSRITILYLIRCHVLIAGILHQQHAYIQTA